MKRVKNDTEKYLDSISRRLSSRYDCKDIEYLVEIQDNRVSMAPRIFVYRNKHQRRPEDKMSILAFIENVVKGRSCLLDVDGRIVIEDVRLVDGNYLYKFSADKKKRRWEKLLKE